MAVMVRYNNVEQGDFDLFGPYPSVGAATDAIAQKAGALVAAWPAPEQPWEAKPTLAAIAARFHFEEIQEG